MEEIKKRLDFGNPFVQHQAVWKLYTEIEKKTKGESSRLTAESPEIPELKLLWQALSGEQLAVGGEQRAVTETAAQALVQLVLSGLADFTFILHGLLNRVPSVRNLGGLVNALGQLMMLQAVAVQDADGAYVCPYALRTPSHPFITVLTHRPSSWCLLTSQVEQLVLHHDVRVQKLSAEILRPFVIFVLLEPTPSHPQASMVRHQLQEVVLDTCHRSAGRDSWLRLLTDTLPCYQINTPEAVFQLAWHVRQLLDVISARDQTALQSSDHNDDMTGREEPRSKCSQELTRVTQIAMSLHLSAVQHQVEVTGLTDCVLQSVQRFPQSFTGEASLSQLCAVLMELGPNCPPALLQLTKEVVIASQVTYSCPVGVAILVLPLLQFLSLQPAAAGSRGPLPSAASQHRLLVSQAAATLRAVETLLKQIADDDAVDKLDILSKDEDAHLKFVFQLGDVKLQHLMGSEVKRDSLTHLLSAVSTSWSNICIWLSHVNKQLADCRVSQGISRHTACIVSAALVVYKHSSVTSLALDTLVHIARLDNTKAPLLLPLLLYCLGRETAPESHLAILETIPKLAQHKLCITPILKTLQALMMSPRLCPLAIRLMTSLWQLQDRCFPQLLKAIGENELQSSPAKYSSQSSSFSLLLVKAMAVKEICHLKPEQHGAELLSPLSNILQSATDVQGAAPSALAMEGLYYLCKAEVIDIQSAWAVLAKKMAEDTRPVVIVKICELFSLVPLLFVSTPEYEKFQESVVGQLWRYTQNAEPLVQGAAFKALASFPVASFRVSHLPVVVCEELHSQVQVVREQQEGGDVTVDALFPFIPGVCYIRLLQLLPESVLQDYEAFLSSMVRKEVENLPRGIYYTATRRFGSSTNQDKAISSIPGFIAQQYEKTKQPGLRPSLAVALLFCYDPPVEVGRDGRPRKHYLVRHGKQFMDTFKTLLNEVPVQPSEWHRSLLMPQAWVSFVDRLCLALIESRKAELDLQVKHGHISDDQLEEKTNTAWLFARDSIVDILKAISRGNPSQQANAVFVLTALIVFMSRFANGLDPELLKECDAATEHLSHSHWLSVAVDTILSIRDVTYRPRGQLLGLGQQRSREDRTAAPTLAQATACVCLGSLVPCLVSNDSDLLLLLLQKLSRCLPGGPQASEYSVLQHHTGLGLGVSLARLFEERFSDAINEKGLLIVWNSMDALEECCLDSTKDNRSGCLLGLALALTGLAQEGKTDSRVHVFLMWEKLSALLERTSPEDSIYQALCFCLACVAGSAFTANILKMEHVNATLHQLEMAHSSNRQITGSSLGLGMLCYTLSKLGHPAVAAVRQTLASKWLKAVGSEDTPPMERIASLNGLLALIGSEQTLNVVQAGVSLTSSDVKVAEVLEVVTGIVQSDPDLGIQCNAAWMLGHLHLSACAVAQTSAAVPPNYAYLAEASFLRAIVHFLLEAGQQGPEFVSEHHVKVALVALQSDGGRVLPPLNWAGVLSPLTRMSFGEEVKRLCLMLAVSQSASSPTSTLFLSSWLTPPLSMTLTADIRRSLLAALPILTKSVPSSVLSSFLELSCCQPFQSSCFDHSLALAVLRALMAALRVPDPPEAVTTVLYTTVTRLYIMLPTHFQPVLYKAMGECLTSVPDQVFDSILAEDLQSDTCTLRGLFIGCYAVVRGSQPVTLLNGLIDGVINSPLCGQHAMLYTLAHCFWQLTELRTETSGPMARLNWLLELLGHTRNVITGVVPLNSAAQTLNKAAEVSVLIVAMAVNLLTSAVPATDLGLDPALMKVLNKEGSNKIEAETEKPVPHWTGHLRETFLRQLPVAVLSFERTPWDQLLPKMFDWLWTLSRVSDDVLSPDLKHYLKAALLILRHSAEFRKTSNWTRILATV